MLDSFEFEFESEISLPPLSSELFPALPLEKGISSLEEALEKCLSSSCKPLFYIAPIPCGGSKSRTVQAFIRRWKAGGFPGEGSVLIMLGSYEEMDAYIAACDLGWADYACFSPKGRKYARYGLGRGKADQARVLFVTHEQFRRQMMGAGGTFEAVTDLHYHGKPRSLRLSDESLVPAIDVSFKLSALEALVDAVAPRNPALADLIDSVRLDNKDRAAGHRMFIPPELREPAFEFAMAAKERMNPDHVKALEGLAYLAGRWAILCQDNRYAKSKAGGLCVVGSSVQLPDDLAPCIIMDASANLRAVYKDWASRTGKVEFLPVAGVSYRNLTLHWWNVGANKSTLIKDSERAKVIGVVAATINGKPDEEWLVVHPMEVRGCSIMDELEAGLHQANAQFVHWGRHLGRNEYRRIKNVIIIGSLHYGDIGFAALHAATTDSLDQPGADAINELADGEFVHHVYQAASRSNLRNIVEGVAGEATVYLMTKDIGERRARLQEAFRDCRILDWEPVTAKPTKKEQHFIEVVTRLFEDGREEVTTKELWQTCGAKRSNYLYDLWDSGLVQAFFEEAGLERVGNSLRLKKLEGRVINPLHCKG